MGEGNFDTLVVLMLENRSFDHMLGNLYTPGYVSPEGHTFDGLTGNEYNVDASGKRVGVYQIQPGTQNAYLLPGADPGEGYGPTNAQEYSGNSTAPPSGAVATMDGFLTDYAGRVAMESRQPRWHVVPGTTPDMIMGMHTPSSLPILSALARGYAVSDRWFSSLPTMTIPNRAFALAGTSQGHMDDRTKSFTTPSIFGQLTQAGVSWKIYGYSSQPLTRSDFTDIANAPKSNFGLFSDFQADAAAGKLPQYVFLEPSWGSKGNSQHPNYDVALGEQLIHDVYYAMYGKPQWNRSMLVITYDEHGGCYDHVSPPWGATPPGGNDPNPTGFGFDRFGVRVPTVLVSPLIQAGSIVRAPDNGPPLDHTSLLKTLAQRFDLQPLTPRSAVAPGFGDIGQLAVPRTDDPLAGVAVVKSSTPLPAAVADSPSHLQIVHAQLIGAQTQTPFDSQREWTAREVHSFIRACGAKLDSGFGLN